MSLIFAGLFVAWIGYAAQSDWRDRRVSNTWITLGLLAGMTLAIAGQDGRALLPRADRLDCALGFVVGLLVLLPAFALRAAGAADIKFLAVLGLWTGMHALLWVWVVASLLAMLHGMVYALATARSNDASTLSFAGLSANPKRGIPYVTYLAVAGAGVTLVDLLNQQAVGLA